MAHQYAARKRRKKPERLRRTGKRRLRAGNESVSGVDCRTRCTDTASAWTSRTRAAGATLAPMNDPVCAYGRVAARKSRKRRHATSNIVGDEAAPLVATSRNVGRLGGPLGAMLASVLPSVAQFSVVEACLGHVQLLVRHVLGVDSAVVVQGSYAQGLALRGSDLDVAVITGIQLGSGAEKRGAASHAVPRARFETIDDQHDTVDRRQALSHLKRLADAVATLKSKEVRVHLRIFGARVPVLRLLCCSGGPERLVVDVSVGAALTRGACDRCVYALLEREASGGAVALCRLVKLWAKRRKLTDTLRGGLSSFGFVLLVVFFLQQLPREGPWPESLRLPPYEAVTGAKPSPAPVDGFLGLLGVHAQISQQCLGRQQGQVAGVRVDERQLTALLAFFFRWASEDLCGLRGRSLCVALGKAVPLRSGQSDGRPIMLAVPFAQDDNAARCLRPDVWEGRVLPEVRRARGLAESLYAGCSRGQSESIVRSLFALVGSARGLDESALEKSESDDEPEETTENVDGDLEDDIDFNVLAERSICGSIGATRAKGTRGRKLQREQTSKSRCTKQRLQTGTDGLAVAGLYKAPATPPVNARLLGLRSLLRST